MSEHKPPVPRYVRYDAWRGHPVPALAVAGSSDTGMWSDSPAPSDKVKAELQKVRREVLTPLGIKARTRYGRTSNVFAAKRWLVVSRNDFDRAAQAMTNYLYEHDSDLRYVHDADLGVLGYVPELKEAA